MRVVLTTNFSPWSPYSGGAQHATHQLAVALSALGHEVAVVYTKPRWERIRVPEALPYRACFAPFVGLRSRRQAPFRPLNAVTVANRVAALLSKMGAQPSPVVVHAQGEEGALLPLLRRRLGFRLAVTPRYPNYPAALLAERPGLRDRVGLYLSDFKYVALGAAVRGADRFCPTSRASAAQVMRAFGVDDARCRVIPNGIDPVFLSRAWDPPGDNGPIVFFGRLDASKGADVLLDALARLSGPRPRTVFIGRGTQLPLLSRRAAALGLAGEVSFRDWKAPAALAETIASASLVVLPSQCESFGNAMLEAMAVGAPLIATTAGSIPELVSSGSTGLLVPPGDPSALAQAMAALLRDRPLARALGAAARRHVPRRYGWEQTARAYEDVYREMGGAI